MRDAAKTKAQLVHELEASAAERKQAEDKARFLGSITEQVRDSIIVTDLDFGITYVNKATEQLFGYSQEELVGRNPEIFNAEPTAADIQQQMREAIFSGEVIAGALVNKKKDGSTFVCEYRVSPLFDNDGRISSYVGIQHDITERREAEEELRKSEQKYHSLVEDSSVGVVAVDITGRFTFVNKALCEMLGYSEEELIQKPFADYLHADDTEATLQSFANAFADPKGKVDLECRVLHKEGRPIHMHASITHIKVDGQTIGFNAMMTDVTESKRMEEALRESEQRYRTILEEMDEGYFELDLNGNLTFCNDSYRQALGYSPEEITGMNYAALVAEADRDRMFEMFTDIYRKGKLTRSFTCQALRKDGTTVTVESEASLLRDKEGQIIGFRGIGRDITERKKVEEKIQQQNEFLSNVLESLTHPFYVIDANDYSIIMANAAAKPAELPASLTCYALTHNRDKPCSGARHTCPLKEIRRTKKDAVMEHIHYDEAGNPRNVEIHAYPVLDTEGNVIQMIEYSLDITERKKMEAELRGFSRHLQAAREQERAQMAREIHDELGQTLTALKMDVAWLRGRLPEGQEPLLNKTESMSDLIDATAKTVRRMSADLRPGLLDDLGITAAIEWQTEEFQDRTGIRCQLGFDPEDVALDQDRSTTIFRILQETLTNVARHSEATRVKVSLKQKGSNLVLRVRDNGRGIAPDKISAAKSFGLMGIRERADLWGGNVKISGVPDKGTTVTISIPLEERKADDKDTRR